MSENIERTITELQTHLSDLEEQVADTKKTINSLCRVAGKPILYADADRKSVVITGHLNGDEYYGKPLTSAARMILESRKAVGRGPATIGEIYDQMVAGGYRFNAKNDDNGKRSLRIALTKASHTFHRLPASGKFGLLDWYESIRPSKSNGFAGKDHNNDGDEDSEIEAEEPGNELTVVGTNATPDVKKKPR